MKENDIVKRGLNKKIIIEMDDENFLKASIKYLESIENEYLKFNEKVRAFEIERKNFKEKNLIHFEPETLSRKSPISIINAPWGWGKSYFVEKFSTHFYNGDIKPRVLKGLLVVDAWKFSSSKNTDLFIIDEIFSYLSKNYATITNTLTDTLDSAAKTIGHSISNRITGPKLRIKEDKHVKLQELIQRIDEKIEPTIIFIDNVERMGDGSWDIIRILSRLTSIKKLLIILPMNLSELNNKNTPNVNLESKIDKFIDLSIYNLEQDYTTMLKNDGFDDSVVGIMNKLLLKPDGERTLSLRNVKTIFRNNDIKPIEDRWVLMKSFVKNAWSSWSKLEECIENETIVAIEKYKKYLEFVNSLIKIQEKIFAKIPKRKIKKDAKNFLKSEEFKDEKFLNIKKNGFINFFSKESKLQFNSRIFNKLFVGLKFNFEDYDEILEIWNKYFKTFSSKISKNPEEDEDSSIIIKENNLKIDEILLEIDNIVKEIETLTSSKKIEKLSSEKQELEIKIKDLDEEIEKNVEKISNNKIETKKFKFVDEIIKTINLNEHIKDEIKEFLKEAKKLGVNEYLIFLVSQYYDQFNGSVEKITKEVVKEFFKRKKAIN